MKQAIYDLILIACEICSSSVPKEEKKVCFNKIMEKHKRLRDEEDNMEVQK